MNQSLVSQVANLLKQAGSAHHTYEQTVLKGVYDQDWPVWYANYVIENGLSDLFARPFTVDGLAARLTAATDLHSDHEAKESWADFVATQLLIEADADDLS